MNTIKKIIALFFVLILSQISFAYAETTLNTDINSDTEILFNWAENNYPQVFPSQQTTQSSEPWLFRFYPEVDVYVGVNTSDSNVYVLGGPWGNISPTNIDTLANLLSTIQASQTGKLSGITSISNNGSYGIKGDGTLWSWGGEEHGATQVLGFPDNITLTNSGLISNDGTLWSWGDNALGTLGNGTTTNSTAAVQVSGLTNVIDTAKDGASRFALQADGTVWAWGTGDRAGLLGVEDGRQERSQTFTTPIQINALKDVSSIATADDVRGLFVTKKDGTVWAMGENRGNGTSFLDRELVQVTGLTDVISFAFAGDGDNNVYALKSDGTVWAWGFNLSGQLGNGTTTESFIPVQVSNLTDVISISAGRDNAYALKSDGTVWAWGKNQVGQLGDGTDINRLTPVQVIGLNNIVSVVPNNSIFSYVLALKDDGTVWAWGNNQEGQLGDGTKGTVQREIPEQVHNLSNITAIAINGWTSNFALKSDGTVWAWGSNSGGKLGDGTTTDRLIPAQVINASK